MTLCDFFFLLDLQNMLKNSEGLAEGLALVDLSSISNILNVQKNSYRNLTK